MLDHPTHTQLREMKLEGIADAFGELQSQDGTADLTHAEWLGLLIDREAAIRETKRFESRMRTARLRHVGPPLRTSITRPGGPSTNRSAIVLEPMAKKVSLQQLLTGKWITDKRNLMIAGPVGWAKLSWPARLPRRSAEMA